MSESNLLLEIETKAGPFASQSGQRVFADGRYEYFGDKETQVGDDGSVKSLKVEPAWRPFKKLDASQLADLRQALKEAKPSEFQERYTPQSSTNATTTQIWRIYDEKTNQLKQITIEGYPANTVAALNNLLAKLGEIYQKNAPESSSTWQLLANGKTVQLVVDCDVSGVESLRPLVQALFSNEAATGKIQTKLDAQTILISVSWKENGQETEKTVVYGDGRYAKLTNNQEKITKVYSQANFNELLEILNKTDWQSLPQPLCE